MSTLPGRRRTRTEMRRKDGRTERGCRASYSSPYIPIPSFRLSIAFVLSLSCNPATTRPDFMPLPEAPSVVLYARPPRVAAEVQTWLVAQGLKVEVASVQDAYVETAWSGTFKIRCWADPDAPGKSRLTVEAVYRPVLDPSRTERDLEVLVPAEHEGAKLVDRMIGDLKKKLGT